MTGKFRSMTIALVLLGGAMAGGTATTAAATDGDAARLVGALLGATPLTDDLRQLTDRIGGRVTGSPANERAVEWGLEKFRQAGVSAAREPFTMPRAWQERSSRATIEGALAFSPRVVARAFSVAANGLAAPLVDGGFGRAADFARLGSDITSAWVLIETGALTDARGIDGLFETYMDETGAERRAIAAGALGVVFMSSRPQNLMFRYASTNGPANDKPLLLMEREGAQRALRSLRAGGRLTLTATIDVADGPAYESANVIAEIKGAERPGEIVLIGAHLDSWGLGTGALDNGANVAMVIDIARQMARLGIKPRRTIRFALFNGEEQGMYGSWAYVRDHTPELDRHIMAISHDIGSGRITGYFTNGRADILAELERALVPVAGLGPYSQVNEPIIGTDNFDFMLEGLPNLVAEQDGANYPSNYHARSDTFDKVNLRQLKLNSAIAAAVTLGFANGDQSYPRQTRADIETLLAAPGVHDVMRAMAVYDDWRSGKRGR